MRHKLLVGLALGSGLAICSIARSQDGAEATTLATMLEAGLSESAQAYALAQRELWKPNAERYALWTKRLMETQAQAALREAERSTADALWVACEQTFAELASALPDNPRLPWVAWQRSRCDLLHAQADLANYLAAPANSAAKERALALIREILRETEELEEDIRRRLPLAARQASGQRTEASPEQLSELVVDIGLLQCEALLIRSRLYPPDSRDRTAAATDVEERARAILAITSDAWESREALEVAQAAAQLELGKADAALAELVRLARDGSPAVAAQAAVFAIEYLTREGEVSRARALLAFLEKAQRNHPQTELAALRLELAEVDPSPATDREQKLSALVARAQAIGQRHGSYWQNRAEALLLGSETGPGPMSATAPALELMLVEVRQLLAAEDEQAAVDKLLEFRDNEIAAGRSDNALRLASQAYALLQRSQQWLPAANALEATTRSMPQSSVAAQAHQLVAYALSQALRSDPENAVLRERYESALVRHLELWPNAENTDAVQAWLETWLVGTQRRLEFNRALRKRVIAAGDSDLVPRMLDDWLASCLQLSSEQQELTRRELETDLAEDALGKQVALSARVTLLAAQAFGAWPDDKLARAQDSEYRELLASATQSRDRLLLDALHLLTLAREREISAARNAAQAWDPSQLTDSLWLQLVPAFIEAIDFAQEQQPSSWSDLLDLPPTAERLISDSDPERQAIGLRLRSWQGEPAALTSLEALVERYPRSGTLQLNLAWALADAGPERMEESTAILRRLAASSPQGSQLNLKARWRWLRNLQLAGREEVARQQAQLLLASLVIDSDLWRKRLQAFVD